MFDIEENLKSLPNKPGVYLHKDAYGEIIYVGKAASLKNRVRQYFQSKRNMDRKVAALATHIAEFEYIVTKTEMEALLLENTLIKRHQPRYNVMLRDDKTYPYIKITLGEKWPRLLKTRILKSDGSRYFGPYADVGAVNRIITLMSDIYRLKRCSMQDFPPGFRLCLNGHIDKCRRICMDEADHDAYMTDIGTIIAFLKGQNTDVIKDLKSRMETAAESMDFEAAARWRDAIAAARSVTAKQRVELLSSGNMDIILSTEANDERVAQVTVFFVRDGRLTGREIHHLDADEGSGKAEITAAFLSQYYVNQTIIPKEILLEAHVEGESLISEMLSENAGRQVRILVPERGAKRELLRLAQHDVSESVRLMAGRIRTERERTSRLEAALIEIIDKIKSGTLKPAEADSNLAGGDLPARLLRLEAYDISNTGGADSVGAMVVFSGGNPLRSAYRRFRIRGEEKGDDYAATQEVLYRRLKRGLSKDKGFDKMPDLILVDGGSGHLSAAMQVTRALHADIPVAGMVKDDRHRTRGLVLPAGEIDLKDRPELFHLIGAIQEEVHRFAIDYHRNTRGKSAIRSELDDVKGIGQKRRNALLEAFGSLEGIRAADEDALAAVPGMNLAAARALHQHFHRRNA